jgi:hypothetical protein
LGTPVPETRWGARLGAPLAVSALTAPADTALVQYVPPLRQRENQDTTIQQLLPGTVQLTLPGRQRLFRLDSEAGVMERMRQEARERHTPDVYEFPEELKDVAASKLESVSVDRQWAVTQELVEPHYVWHTRLLFEQINSDRYGWTLGVIQPAICAAHFYADVLTLPYHRGVEPCRFGDTSAGKCLPGDPVPLLLYPPQRSWTGLATEAAVAVPLFVAFP